MARPSYKNRIRKSRRKRIERSGKLSPLGIETAEQLLAHRELEFLRHAKQRKGAKRRLSEKAAKLQAAQRAVGRKSV